MQHTKLSRIRERIDRNVQRARAFHGAGQPARAERCALDVLEDDPAHAEMWTLLGLIAYGRGNWLAAVERFQRALAAAPRGDANSFLGLAYQRLGRFDECIRSHRAAIECEPDSARWQSNLGNALYDNGDTPGAIEAYDRALRLAPDATAIWYNYAVLFHNMDRYPEAAECCRQIMQSKDSTATINGADAVNPFTRGLSLLTYVNQQMCDWNGLEELMSRVRQAARQKSRDILPFQVLSMPSDHALQLTAAQSFGSVLLTSPNTWAGPQRPAIRQHERLRVGYVSSDLHTHPTAFLIAELFELHHRDRFEIFGYSLGRDDGSQIRRRIAASIEHFADCRRQSLADIANQIRQDEIDVLVDLKGYTKDCSPGIFALRPAPIQVNYLGYPGTMGVDFMDYLMVDDFIVPSDQQRFYSEKLVHLPDCYQITDAKRVIARTPSRGECGLPEHGLVFCCFNFPYKITPPIFDIWMRLLGSIPDSVLWLLSGNSWAAANLKSQAAARNVDPNRIIFAPKLPQAEHLARVGVADLFLDTYPVTAHTTASDALWAGCPLVTYAGNTFISRVAGSILRAAGLPELIASSLDEYEAIVMRLAKNREELAQLKVRLAQNRGTCRLFDAAGTTRGIEAAYERMWEIYRSGRPPQPFAVTLESVKSSNYVPTLSDCAYPSERLSTL